MEFTRVNSDFYGNPRYVVHYTDCKPSAMITSDISNSYDRVVKLMNKIGGRKFHNKQYGGGIVFQTYSIGDTEKSIERVKAEYDKKQRGL